MGDLIVGGLIALMVILILRSLHKAVAKSGACAFCSYAKNGCDHVGHHELDFEHAESRLNATQKAILAKHRRKFTWTHRYHCNRPVNCDKIDTIL